MSPVLTEDLVRALDAQGDAPLRTVHPATGKAFFIISEDRYERLKPLFESDPLSADEQRGLLDQAGQRAGWNDPAMDAYDRYNEHRP
jgi:hypothetical protein